MSTKTTTGPRDYSDYSEDQLRRIFKKSCFAVMAGGSVRDIYIHCNTMRNAWKELRRRGLPDPKFPDDEIQESFDKVFDKVDKVFDKVDEAFDKVGRQGGFFNKMTRKVKITWTK